MKPQILMQNGSLKFFGGIRNTKPKSKITSQKRSLRIILRRNKSKNTFGKNQYINLPDHTKKCGR